MEYKYLIVIFIFTLLFRSMIRIILPKLIDYDTYFHIFLINYIRKNGTSNFIDENKLVMKASFDYPWLLHWILSKIPKKIDSYVERFFNPLLDSLFSIIIFLILYNSTLDIEKSFYGVLIYIFTPITFSLLSTGPRVKSLTPRLFGEIMGSLVFISEYYYLLNDNNLFLFSSIIFASFVFLSSKFALQTLIFMNIILSLLFLNIYFIIVIICGFLIALAFSRGKVIFLLRQQFNHLIWYFKNNLKGNTPVGNRNNYTFLYELLKSRNIKKIVNYFFTNNTLSIVILKFPIYLISVYISINNLLNNNLNILDYFIFASLIIFILTSMRLFLFLGEAERYLNFIIIFSILTIINNLAISIISILIIYGAIFYSFEFIYTFKNSRFKKEKEDIAIRWLNTKSKVLNISTIPLGFMGHKVIALTQHNRLYALDWLDPNDVNYYQDNFSIDYDFVKLDKLDLMFTYYKLDYCFVDKKLYKNKYKKDFIIPNGFKYIDIEKEVLALYR